LPTRKERSVGTFTFHYLLVNCLTDCVVTLHLHHNISRHSLEHIKIGLGSSLNCDGEGFYVVPANLYGDKIVIAVVGYYFGGGNSGKDVLTINPYTWKFGFTDID